MEDGDEPRPYVVEAVVRMSQFTVVAAHVSRIRFLEPDRAEVRFSVEIDPGPIRISRDGTAIRHEERWVVSRATIAMMLAPIGVHLPPA